MQFKIRHWLVSFVLLCALTIAGCAAQQETSSNSSAPPANATPAQSANLPGSNLPKLEGKATVVMMVKGSAITIEVDGTNAPITAGNFIDLVNRGVYDGLAFHRVVREPEPFVVQGGDPQSKDPAVSIDNLGTGSFIDPATSRPRYIPLEIKPKGAESPVYSKTLGSNQVPVLRHTRGAVAMARSMPTDSASSQFYFTLADLSFLDGKYAVFGYVTQGMDVVDKIQCDGSQCDRIESAKVTRGLENLKQGS